MLCKHWTKDKSICILEVNFVYIMNHQMELISSKSVEILSITFVKSSVHWISKQFLISYIYRVTAQIVFIYQIRLYETCMLIKWGSHETILYVLSLIVSVSYISLHESWFLRSTQIDHARNVEVMSSKYIYIIFWNNPMIKSIKSMY